MAITVTVELGPELERYVSEKLRRGEFRDADDMMRVALQRMAEEEAEMAHTEALLREAEDSGDYIDLNEDEWKAIQREALAIVEQRKGVSDRRPMKPSSS